MNALLQQSRKVLFAGLLIAAACAARSQDIDRPLLLVATPDLEGLYSRTALLVVPAANGQHIGFIINRATEVKLATLFPEHAPSAKVVDPVYFGGPEMVGAIFAMVRRDPGVPALHLFGDLFVTGNGPAVDRIIEQTPNDARYFTGFVGWQAGELAKELESGFWYVTDPDAALPFSDETGGMWEQLLKRVGKPHVPAGMNSI
ncbi:MAG TPA: YqgE/AlgH family protein [Burkholderiales bacterium]|nr:YqgE/AlgH family protein [Burkholderiales bacterium]